MLDFLVSRKSETGLSTDLTINSKASAVVPANYWQGDFQTSASIAESSIGSYVSSDPTSTPSDYHRGVSTIEGSRQTSESNHYYYSQLLGPEYPALDSTQRFSHQSDAQGHPQTMATTVLRQSQHNFGTVAGQYPSGVYAPYPGLQDSTIPSAVEVPNALSDQQNSYTSPQRWAAQQVFGHRTSKSPSTRDRTPIRHNRPEMSRHRSGSRPEMLLAYVEDQAQQMQRVRPDRSLFVHSMEPTQPAYHPQAYAFTPVTSPYLHQQPYYDPGNTSASYAQLPTQQNQNNASLYATARHEIQLPQVPGPTLNPSDTLYTQSRAQQMPSIASVPSNFPPIPQPLESTPNEVDVVGSRQKPQCWDHGCNGRQFSTFSNLLRHQREKSGTANKARCPHCGTEFTRTTARNGHLYGGKCKGISEQDKDMTTQEKDEGP